VDLILKPDHSTPSLPHRLGLPARNWRLERDGESIGLIERTTTGVWLGLPSVGNWRCEVSRHGLGWGLEVTPVDGHGVAGAYRSRTLLARGRLSLSPGNTYHLEPPLRRDAWRLSDETDELLAEVRLGPADSLLGEHLHIDLTGRSDREPQVLLVVMIACVVIASHMERPVPVVAL
jgi:hypothetical protein